jgi:hypothetical protein
MNTRSSPAAPRFSQNRQKSFHHNIPSCLLDHELQRTMVARFSEARKAACKGSSMPGNECFINNAALGMDEILQPSGLKG